MEFAAGGIISKQVIESTESGHVTLLVADAVKCSGKLVRKGRAERRLPAARRPDLQDSHRPGGFQMVQE